jgi:hypothetical protein
VANYGAGAPFNGKVFSAQVYSGIPTFLDGVGGETLKVDFNPDRDATTPTGTITSSTTGEVWTINGASSVVRNAAYHGSMVDGVKCYDTDRLGNPIATTGSYPIVGYVPWEAQSNIAVQSNAFTTTWTQQGTPTPTQDAIGPDGGLTAWTLTDNSAVVAEDIFQSITLTAAPYTFSMFVKKTTGAQSAYPVYYANTGTTFALCTVDTSNGVATAWAAIDGGNTILAGVSARCTSYNSIFWRVELTYTATAASYVHLIYPAGTTNATQSSGAINVAAQGSHVFYGAMVNLGAFAGPYIPTTTVAVARNANVLTYTGADVANIKTLACTFSRVVGPNGGVCCALSNGTLSQRAQVAVGTTDVTFYGDSAGVKWNQTASNAYVIGTTAKVAFSMATNDIKMDFNGTSQTPDTVATLPTVTQLNVGHVAEVGVLNGAVKHVYGWTRNLSQSELGAIDA